MELYFLKPPKFGGATILSSGGNKWFKWWLGWRIRPGPFGISWGVLPHARVQGDMLGAEGDPSAGCALPDITVAWICDPARRQGWR